jgi:hypothetical protein
VSLDTNIVYADVHAERERAHAKHGAAGNSREDATWDNAEWLPILMEEVGEAAHELTYDVQPKPGELDGEAGVKARLRKELVQVAAMTCAWIDAIDRSTG